MIIILEIGDRLTILIFIGMVLWFIFRSDK